MSDTQNGADGATPTSGSTVGDAPNDQPVDAASDAAPVRRPRTRATTPRATKKAAAQSPETGATDASGSGVDADVTADAAPAPAKKAARKRATRKSAPAVEAPDQSPLATTADAPSAPAAGDAAPVAGVQPGRAEGASAELPGDGPIAAPPSDTQTGADDSAPPARKRASRRRAAPVTSPFDTGTGSDQASAAAAPAVPAPADASVAADAPTAPRAGSRTRRTPARSTTELFVAPAIEAAAPSSAALAGDASAPDEQPADGAAAPRQRRRRPAAVPLFQAPTEAPAAPAAAEPSPVAVARTDSDASDDAPPARPSSRSTRSRSRSRSGALPADTALADVDAARATEAPDAEALDVEPLEADALHADTLDGDVVIDAADTDGADAEGADLDASDDDEDAADDEAADDSADTDESAEAADGTTTRRRRRRGGRGRRRKPANEDESGDASEADGSADRPSSDQNAVEGVAADSGSAIDDSGDSPAPTTTRSSSRTRSRSRGGSGQPTDQGESGSSTGDQPTTGTSGDAAAETSGDKETGGTDAAESDQPRTSSSSRRRRSRRRAGESTEAPSPDDPPQTVVRVREPRPSTDDDVTSLKGSTRLEAKKQRRRDGRDQGRRRSPVITEAEFLARRESVDRVMLVRQSGSRTQIAVLEDGVLVEHYVAHASQTSTVGNVYLGKVQNVLPAMEAAFIDIGKGRNAVLYAGEVAWSRMGLDGKARRMESVLSSGQSVLVQVTKDPVGSKGARLTGLVSLPGRFLVYAPGGSMSGISRKLPEKERARLKAIVKKVFPDEASVIIRTAAEGATEEELSEDIHRLEAQWLEIEAKAATASAPATLYSEPDLAIKVVRDMFNEDFASLVISGDEAWSTLQPYVAQVAPDLVDRLSRWTSEADLFAEYRVDEQIAKALDRKVWLPSGGSLVIDRTEAMTVVDVNTGKFTGSGGNLEATVTKNNLEAAEEIVRQIRLRDIGGIIVIDFIDMVLENNRDLVLRRVVECLGRDRTRHQVAEVTSLGLVQMTRKRVGQGLLDVFSEPCEHCNGRGVKIHYEPVESIGGDPHEQTPQPPRGQAEPSGRAGRSRRGTPAAAPAQSDGPPRPGPADVIRAVALAAANRTAAVDQDSDAADEPGLPDEPIAAAEDLEAFDATDDQLSESSSAGPELDASTDAGLPADPEVVEVPSADSGVNGYASTFDAGDRDADEVPDTDSPESGEAPARRSRRTRSTRRPAGPPRPVSSVPVQVPGVITATELPAIAASIAPVDAASSQPSGSEANGAAPSDSRDPSTDDSDPVGSSTEGDGSPEGTAELTVSHQLSEAPSEVDGAAPSELDGGAAASTDQPSARAARRRRATRPAGAPTS